MHPPKVFFIIYILLYWWFKKDTPKDFNNMMVFFRINLSPRYTFSLYIVVINSNTTKWRLATYNFKFEFFVLLSSLLISKIKIKMKNFFNRRAFYAKIKKVHRFKDIEKN